MRSAPELRIRPAVAGDAPRLAEFAARTFTETYAGEIPPRQIREHLDSSFGVELQAGEIVDPDTETLLAFMDESLVAYAQLRRRPAPKGLSAAATVELRRFYLDRATQGRGVAPVLMAAVREAARSLGNGMLWLSVWERNPRAIGFYRKQGFHIAGETGTGVDREVRMERRAR